VCRPKHVEKLRNIGIINSTTRLHLVGSFYEIYLSLFSTYFGRGMWFEDVGWIHLV